MIIFLLILAFWPKHGLAAPATTSIALPFRHLNGHFIAGSFRTFYEANGDTAAFGLPLTDALIESGGLTVQYFTYARFEWHDRVELTHLGRWAATNHSNAAAFAWVAADAPIAPGRTYIPESGHTIGGAFAWYWNQNGGVQVLGYPISEEFIEAQADGQERLVQYFERAVLAYHPESAGTVDEVRRLPLGERFAVLDTPDAQRAPRPEPKLLAQAELRFNPRSGDGTNITRAAERLHGATIDPGGRIGFLEAIGPITAEAGYVPGSAIVGGEIVNDTIGGGICTVSTLLYRAAWRAGLPILERTAHRYWLNAYADAPGLEAAVYDPSVELRVANDTGALVYVAAGAVGDRVVVQLWGYPDGRKVMVEQPEVHAASTAPGGSAASTPTNTAQLADVRAPANAQQEGADVVNIRTVLRADGSVLREERVVTRYAPLPQDEETPAEDQDDTDSSGENPDGPR